MEASSLCPPQVESYQADKNIMTFSEMEIMPANSIQTNLAYSSAAVHPYVYPHSTELSISFLFHLASTQLNFTCSLNPNIKYTKLVFILIQIGKMLSRRLLNIVRPASTKTVSGQRNFISLNIIQGHHDSR